MDDTEAGSGPAELVLHQRLLDGDATATAEAAERYLVPLTERLLRLRRDVHDSQIVEQAAIDALLSYIRRPQQFDPSRSRLEGYLLRAAQGDLNNALRSERRHTFRSFSLDDERSSVALSLVDGNTSVEEEALGRLGIDFPDGLDRGQTLALIAAEFPNALDRRLLMLLLDGERHTAAYAGLLEISELPAPEQRREVKRHKDRIQKRLQRLRSRLGVQQSPS